MVGRGEEGVAFPVGDVHPPVLLHPSGSALLTNAIMLCLLVTLKDQWEKVRFSHVQVLPQLFLTVFCDLSALNATHLTVPYYLCSSGSSTRNEVEGP